VRTKRASVEALALAVERAEEEGKAEQAGDIVHRLA